MRSTALAIACLLSLARIAAAAEPSIANEELLQSARLWEGRQRGDLARLALEKLVNTRPDSPDALLALGELELRMSDFVSAERVLQQLEQRFKESAATRSMQVQYRLATHDRLPWLSIQRLSQLGEHQAVRRELDKLFPQGAPEGVTAIEYYRLLSGSTPKIETKVTHAPAQSRRRVARPSPAPPPPNAAAVQAAETWEHRSRSSADAQQLQLASLQLEAAVAFRTGNYEAVIPVASALTSLGFADQAGELLAVARELAPQSVWLFETRVRWLIAHSGASQALELLDARTPDENWTASNRNTLRAAALDARARASIASSDEEAAIADLQAAIGLEPADPWKRHRLATLLAHRGKEAEGRRWMEEGAAIAPNQPQMRFAQALYLESIGDAQEAFAVIDSIPPQARDPDMNSLRVRSRLAVIGKLIESGDVTSAREQLASVRAEAAPDDAGVQLVIAYRESQLGNHQAAAQIAESILRLDPSRADVAMLAARSNLSQRHFGAAREYFKQAELNGDADTVLAARQSREQIENRVQHWMTAGAEIRRKPGDAGISRFDSIVIPTLWHYARNYEQRLWLQADAVSVDAGKLSAEFDRAALFGSILAAGPTAERRHRNDTQRGLAIGLGYVTDNFAVDIGSTPLGFELPQVVGGFEWRPTLADVSVSFGLSRRAVTSSVLSYAGMRDPISGVRWGAVVQTGPYADAGIYRERYSVAAALRFSEITGEHVLDNKFFGARTAADWKFLLQPYARASLGVAVNYWSFDHNLQNYTLGSGGYYSPQSYVSVALPLEISGEYRDWSYRLRAAVAYTQSTVDAIAFYPENLLLQSAAARFFEDDRSSGTSLSAYAAMERQVSSRWIAGAKLDIDRADYYDPTVFMIYLRHTFAPATTRIAVPPRPAQAYNEK